MYVYECRIYADVREYLNAHFPSILAVQGYEFDIHMYLYIYILVRHNYELYVVCRLKINYMN